MGNEAQSTIISWGSDDIWYTILQFAFLLALLGISLFVKLKISFFRRHLIPTALFGGLLGFIVCQVLGWFPFTPQSFEKIVYHFTAIGFIALALKKRQKKTSENITNTGFAIVNVYIFQAVIGLGVTLLLAATILPELFPNFGLLLPFSFGQGPGQANNLGGIFESLTPAAKAMENGSNAGLWMATFGFLWAIIGGIPYMNILRKKYNREKKLTPEAVTSIEPDIQEHTSDVPKTVFLDDLSIQAVLIGVCYLLTYLLLKGLEALLGAESSLVKLFWGFQFLFGTLIAILMRSIMDFLNKHNITKVHIVDNYLLQRVSSVSFDIMIVASVCAISFSVLMQYLVPMLIVTTLGGIFTMIFSSKMAKWLYHEDTLEHAVGLYGMWTGTVVTGMALLKEIDPAGKSSVPESLVLGSGFAAIIGIPMMLVVNIPITAWLNDNPWLYVVTFGVMALYSAICFVGIVMVKRKYSARRAKKTE